VNEMKPKGTRKSYSQRLSAREKRKILAETRKGTLQIEIAGRFGCDVSTIRIVQKAAGIGRWVTLTPEVERECVALLRLGHGQARVAKMTRVSQPKIRLLMKKYRIHHLAGDPGLALKNPDVLRKIDAAIKRRENYVVQIAKQHNVSVETVRKRAHALLGPGKFLSSWPPLESYIPQKWFETMPTNDDAEVALHVADFVNRCFNGQLLESRLVDVSIEFCLQVFRRERPELELSSAEWERVKGHLLPHFRVAATRLQFSGNGLVN
jgi:hypothetical protein